MGHDGVVSGNCFRRLIGCQRDPRDRGVTALYQSLGKRLPRELECGYPQVWS